jgi:lysozyme
MRVLANMAFNAGVDGLLKFRRMLLAVERGHYDQAAREMLQSKWATQVFGRAVRLAEMMAKG